MRSDRRELGGYLFGRSCGCNAAARSECRRHGTTVDQHRATKRGLAMDGPAFFRSWAFRNMDLSTLASQGMDCAQLARKTAMLKQRISRRQRRATSIPRTAQIRNPPFVFAQIVCADRTKRGI
jgi:hypothetical protein